MIDFIATNKTRDVANFFYIIGEAVCMIQLLEDALNHSITLKSDVRSLKRIPKEDADRYLKKHQSQTLGNAIRFAKEEALYSDELQNDLTSFLKERNWLIHKCVPYHIDDLLEVSNRDRLFQRVKTICKRAQGFRHTIEMDLIEFSEAKGLEMSKARVAVKKSYVVS